VVGGWGDFVRVLVIVGVLAAIALLTFLFERWRQRGNAGD
jgi:hypothetical protein